MSRGTCLCLGGITERVERESLPSLDCGQAAMGLSQLITTHLKMSFTDPRYVLTMILRRTLKAVPARVVPLHRRRRQVHRRAVLLYLAISAATGAVIGATSVASSEVGRTMIAQTLKPLAIRLGVVRARSPQFGDEWSDCHAARTAGTAPIYVGEPGYRKKLDRDHDGVACEPHRDAF